MSALMLKLVACVTMLIDHLGYSPHNMVMRIIGRIAFPIFLYLICNGYRHTSSKTKYALRLAIFALISQIPFTLFVYNKLWYAYGNVFFTLLISLLCIWSADAMLKHRILKWGFFLPTLAVFAVYHFGYIKSDYGANAILLAMVFFLFDGKKLYNKALMLVGMICATYYQQLLSIALGILKGRENVIPQIGQWKKVQIFSVVALVFIFLYNGKKGKVSDNPKVEKLVQYGFYAFYPVHLLVLWAIRVIF